MTGCQGCSRSGRTRLAVSLLFCLERQCASEKSLLPTDAGNMPKFAPSAINDSRPELPAQLSVCQFHRFCMLLEMVEVSFAEVKLSISAVKPL